MTISNALQRLPENAGGKCPRSRGMAPYFTELDGLPPDQGFKRVGEIFHVD
jgi:hypothetical protein